MRVLMLSQDLVPDAQSARARRVRFLADALVQAGHDVHLIVAGGVPGTSTERGVQIVRTAEYPPMIDPAERVAWALQFNAAVLEAATRLSMQKDFDVLHAH